MKKLIFHKQKQDVLMYSFSKKIFFAFFFTFSVFLSGISQNIFDNNTCGTLIKQLSFYSNTLDQDVNYSIYLPAEYYNSNETYPVLYILHGYGGNDTMLLRNNMMVNALDSLLYNQIIPPFIFVMPNGYNTYYINDYRNTFRYEDMFINEFIPFIDNTYKTIANRNYRGISGISMGGYGCIILTMKHPRIFGHCLAISAALRNDSMIINESDNRWKNSFSKLYGDNLKGEERITEHWKSNNPLYIVSNENAGILNKINWYLDCGYYDYLFPGNLSLNQLFFQYKINHTFISLAGNHNWLYWGKSIERAFLQFGYYFYNIPFAGMPY